jgi:prepilin-type N-terminal cleavage/methylation domain-containing protein
MLNKIRSFTLVELIIVVIIVGILASLGLTQYSLVVEKARLAEAKTHIGVMRNLAYEYYLNNGDMSAITSADVGAENTCVSTDFYRYGVGSKASTWANLVAVRCSNGGKAPNATASLQYVYYLRFYPGTGQNDWHCYYPDNSPCFGLTP